MTRTDLQNLISADAQQIADAIASGAGWEIWMQIHLYLRIKASGASVARELPYPAPYGTQRLDLRCRDNQGDYAIELKVESATNAGAAIMAGIAADVAKIANYTGVTARWVIGLGYSSAALNAMQAFGAIPANNAIYATSAGIGFVIVNVP